MNCINCKANCGARGIYHEINCAGYIPMTNADKIRAMTDEELACIFENCDCCVCEFSDGDGYCAKNGKCYQAWLEWLKEEVKENAN